MVLRTGVAADGSGGSNVGSPYPCTVTTPWDGTSLVLTCDTTGDDPTFASFDGVGLTVVSVTPRRNGWGGRYAAPPDRVR